MKIVKMMKIRKLGAVVGLAGMMAASMASAAPSGLSFVIGSGTIDVDPIPLTTGANTTITTGTQNTIMNASSFNVKSFENVTVNMPDEGLTVINDLQGVASQIDGSVLTTGINADLIVNNKNGINVGASATIGSHVSFATANNIQIDTLETQVKTVDIELSESPINVEAGAEFEGGNYESSMYFTEGGLAYNVIGISPTSDSNSPNQLPSSGRAGVDVYLGEMTYGWYSTVENAPHPASIRNNNIKSGLLTVEELNQLNSNDHVVLVKTGEHTPNQVTFENVSVMFDENYKQEDIEHFLFFNESPYATKVQDPEGLEGEALESMYSFHSDSAWYRFVDFTRINDFSKDTIGATFDGSHFNVGKFIFPADKLTYWNLLYTGARGFLVKGGNNVYFNDPVTIGSPGNEVVSPWQNITSEIVTEMPDRLTPIQLIDQYEEGATGDVTVHLSDNGYFGVDDNYESYGHLNDDFMDKINHEIKEVTFNVATAPNEYVDLGVIGDKITDVTINNNGNPVKIVGDVRNTNLSEVFDGAAVDFRGQIHDQIITIGDDDNLNLIGGESTNNTITINQDFYMNGDLIDSTIIGEDISVSINGSTENVTIDVNKTNPDMWTYIGIGNALDTVSKNVTIDAGGTYVSVANSNTDGLNVIGGSTVNITGDISNSTIEASDNANFSGSGFTVDNTNATAENVVINDYSGQTSNLINSQFTATDTVEVVSNGDLNIDSSILNGANSVSIDGGNVSLVNTEINSDYVEIIGSSVVTDTLTTINSSDGSTRFSSNSTVDLTDSEIRSKDGIDADYGNLLDGGNEVAEVEQGSEIDPGATVVVIGDNEVSFKGKINNGGVAPEPVAPAEPEPKPVETPVVENPIEEVQFVIDESSNVEFEGVQVEFSDEQKVASIYKNKIILPEAKKIEVELDEEFELMDSEVVDPFNSDSDNQESSLVSLLK